MSSVEPQPITPAPGPPTVEDLHARVRAWIVQGDLPPGEVMSQVKLAARLGVGRTPLREALRMLQREGLIEGEYNRRVRIAPLSITDLDQLYAQRIMQETVAIRLTVPSLTESDLATIEHLLADMARTRDDAPEEWGNAHRTFHQTLVSHAGDRLIATVADLSDHAERYRRALLEQRPVSYDIGAEEHRSIAEACAAGDAQAAGERLARHLGRTALSLISITDPAHDPVAVREALRLIIGSAAPPTPFLR